MRRLVRRLLGGLALTSRGVSRRSVRCSVAGRSVEVEIARREGALRRGLSGRRRLDPDRGLLLLLPSQSGQGAISTRGMRFEIDVVFLDERGRVVEIASRLAPGLFPGHPVPAGAAAALELVGGRATELGIVVGARLAELSVDGLDGTDDAGAADGS